MSELFQSLCVVPGAKRPRVRVIRLMYPGSLDARVAHLLAKHVLPESGIEIFPGIAEAATEYVDGTAGAGLTPAEADALLEREGIICLNFGGSVLDHHPHGEHPGECTTSRVFTLGGLSGDEGVERFVKYVVYDDTRRQAFGKTSRPDKWAGAYMLGPLFKKIQDDYEPATDPIEHRRRVITAAERADQWLLTFLRAEWKDMMDFLDARQEVSRLTPIHQELRGKTITIVVGVSSNRKFAVAARSSLEHGADIVVQFHPRGGASISFAARWCGDSGGSSMLLNRSRQHHDVEPTILTTELLADVVVAWLGWLGRARELPSRRLPADTLASRVRFAELQERRRRGLPVPPEAQELLGENPRKVFRTLQAEGTLPACPWWYLLLAEGGGVRPNPRRIAQAVEIQTGRRARPPKDGLGQAKARAKRRRRPRGARQPKPARSGQPLRVDVVPEAAPSAEGMRGGLEGTPTAVPESPPK